MNTSNSSPPIESATMPCVVFNVRESNYVYSQVGSNLMHATSTRSCRIYSAVLYTYLELLQMKSLTTYIIFKHLTEQNAWRNSTAQALRQIPFKSFIFHLALLLNQLYYKLWRKILNVVLIMVFLEIQRICLMLLSLAEKFLIISSVE